MQSSFDRPSARIYQFRPKTGLALSGQKAVQSGIFDYKTGKSSDIIVTGAWYHDAAIKDDDRGRKG